MNERPNQSTIIRQWIQKAENDFISAKTLYAELENCPYDTICFHAQQCIEKYIKALLLHQKINFPKSHDVGELMELLPKEYKIPLTPEEQAKVTYYAVAGRYPVDGMVDISRQDAECAIQMAENVREYIGRFF